VVDLHLILKLLLVRPEGPEVLPLETVHLASLLVELVFEVKMIKLEAV
jgi:hypothetical protein